MSNYNRLIMECVRVGGNMDSLMKSIKLDRERKQLEEKQRLYAEQQRRERDNKFRGY